ncbi:hypothetical protein THOM_1069 [Trachipleistophora hominis]|uniref:Uncharacterized protein n=1 Tax=Trachipleistophora hominis TaxID=72359 RepID=L7JXC3_TRAHO|nr:hypothetical protein THOM_1069 [Trachipleistophora hominis]
MVSAQYVRRGCLGSIRNMFDSSKEKSIDGNFNNNN